MLGLRSILRTSLTLGCKCLQDSSDVSIVVQRLTNTWSCEGPWWALWMFSRYTTACTTRVLGETQMGESRQWVRLPALVCAVPILVIHHYLVMNTYHINAAHFDAMMISKLSHSNSLFLECYILTLIVLAVVLPLLCAMRSLYTTQAWIPFIWALFTKTYWSIGKLDTCMGSLSYRSSRHALHYIIWSIHKIAHISGTSGWTESWCLRSCSCFVAQTVWR
jgi:hypothetical protein